MSYTLEKDNKTLSLVNLHLGPISLISRYCTFALFQQPNLTRISFQPQPLLHECGCIFPLHASTPPPKRAHWTPVPSSVGSQSIPKEERGEEVLTRSLNNYCTMENYAICEGVRRHVGVCASSSICTCMYM